MSGFDISGFVPSSGGFNPKPRRPHTRSYSRKIAEEQKNSSETTARHGGASGVSEDTYFVSGNGELRSFDSANFKASGILFYRSSTTSSSAPQAAAAGEKHTTFEALVGMNAKKDCITLIGGKREKTESYDETASREFFEETGALLSHTNQVLLKELLKSSDDCCLKGWLGRASKSAFSSNSKYILHMINIDAMEAEKYTSLREEVETLPAKFASSEGSVIRDGLEKQFREMKSLHFISFDALFKKSCKGEKTKKSSTHSDDLKVHRFVEDGIRANKTFVALAHAIQTTSHGALVASHRGASDSELTARVAEDMLIASFALEIGTFSIR